MLLAVLQEPIDYSDPHGHRPRVIAMILARSMQGHLVALSRAIKLFGDAELVDRLSPAPDASSAIRADSRCGIAAHSKGEPRMKLTVPEAATLLGANQERVYDWIEDDGLPAQRIRGQYRINRAELLEWATEHDITLRPGVFARSEDPESAPSLADALRAGGIHFGIPGGPMENVLRAIIDLLPLDDDVDRDTLFHKGSLLHIGA